MNNAEGMLKAGLQWIEAKRRLGVALSETEKWIKTKGKSNEVVDPLPFLDLWEDLGKAESELQKQIQKEATNQF